MRFALLTMVGAVALGVFVLRGIVYD